jgi:hypothetical protein
MMRQLCLPRLLQRCRRLCSGVALDLTQSASDDPMARLFCMEALVVQKSVWTSQARSTGFLQSFVKVRRMAKLAISISRLGPAQVEPCLQEPLPLTARRSLRQLGGRLLDFLKDQLTRWTASGSSMLPSYCTKQEEIKFNKGSNIRLEIRMVATNSSTHAYLCTGYKISLKLIFCLCSALRRVPHRMSVKV